MVEKKNSKKVWETFRVCFCCSRSFKVKGIETPLEIKRLFDRYSRNDRMSADELLRFVHEVQGEREADMNYVKDIFHSVKHHNVFHPRGLHLDAFYRYLLNDINSPLPLTPKVHHDMNAPLSHYFLYTGHNSYLTGNQLNSRSSAEPIVKALRRGVRVIELDLWPSPDGNTVEVRHGGTLTSHEDLHKCLSAIKDNAFQKTDYPVVITFEEHLPPNLQEKVAVMVRKTFRGMLFQGGSESTEYFPSPEKLKNKILISTKPPEEYLRSQSMQRLGTLEDREDFKPGRPRNLAAGEEPIVEEDEERVAPGYRNMIAIHAGKPKSGLKNCLRDDASGQAIRLSMSEQELETLLKTCGSEVVRFTQRNLLRIYPKGTRVGSSNYDPLVAWTHGAQMVAFNMQKHDKHLWIMQGMFRANGGCGYVKKPEILLSTDPNGRVFDPRDSLPFKTSLKVKIHGGEGWNLDFHQTHFDQYSPPDFFVKIGIAGVPNDTVSYRTETVVDNWRPFWNKEFEFWLSVPELALLWITVKDYDSNTQNDFAGQTCLPLSELKSGIRAVRLHDPAGNLYKNVRLLVRFQFETLYAVQFSD